MADETGISWTDKTFNPWVGCAKVSPGCAHCYAETIAENRMGWDVWGDSPRHITVDATWRKPVAWNRESERFGRTRLKQNPGGVDERIRVFCASMGDVFEPLPELTEPRERLFRLIADTPALDWLILTKRPEVARAWLFDYYMRSRRPREWVSRDGLGWGVLPNVWVGASIENSRYTYRADVLREIPAAVRFVSAEPLLGSLIEGTHNSRRTRQGSRAAGAPGRGALPPGQRAPLDLTGIDWLIVGGESGQRLVARPMHPRWVRELRDECQRLEALTDERPALHFKQWGSYTPAPSGYHDRAVFVTTKGRILPPLALDMYDFDAADINGATRMRYAGGAPTSGGKFLDGTDWCEFPETRTLTPA